MELIKRSKAESAQRFFELFLFYGQLIAKLLLAMTFLRFLTFWASLDVETDFQWLDVVSAFWTGFRFDLLVLGFVGIPVMLVGFGLSVVGRGLGDDFQKLKNYLFGFWILFSILSFFDLDFFIYHARHMQWPDHQAMDYFSTLLNSAHVISSETLIMTLAIWICASFIAGRSLFATVPRFQWGQKSTSGIAWKLIVPLLSVSFMARGTLSARHLELQNSQLSPSAKLNEIALNPAWTLDKIYQR